MREVVLFAVAVLASTGTKILLGRVTPALLPPRHASALSNAVSLLVLMILIEPVVTTRSPKVRGWRDVAWLTAGFVVAYGLSYLLH